VGRVNPSGTGATKDDEVLEATRSFTEGTYKAGVDLNDLGETFPLLLDAIKSSTEGTLIGVLTRSGPAEG
jgi:hypothetical protein